MTNYLGSDELGMRCGCSGSYRENRAMFGRAGIFLFMCACVCVCVCV